MKLYLILNLLLNSLLLTQLKNVDNIESVASQNRIIIFILIAMLVLQAVVIILMWFKLKKVHKERIDDLKERLTAEENLRNEIKKIYTTFNMPK